MKKLLSFSLSVLLAAALGSCAQDANTAQQEGQPVTSDVSSDSTGTKAQQMAYICPMECEGSASRNPGKCPVCGMDLVKNPNHTATPDSTRQH